MSCNLDDPTSNDLPPLKDVIKYLGNKKPDQEELRRLTEYYPKYEAPHRFGVLVGYFDGATIDEIVNFKYVMKNISEAEVVKQSKGGNVVWSKNKIKNLIIRIQYLRYRLDDGMSKREANGALRKRNHYELNKFLDLETISALTRKTHTKALN